MPNINDRIGSQNVIRVLSNASAPPTRLVNLTDVNSTLKTKDGVILVWDVSTETFIMTDIIDSSSLNVTGIASFSNTTQSDSPTTGALVVNGGLGVGKQVYLGAGITITGISTFASDLDINAAVDILNGLKVNQTFESVGITTLASSGGITTTGGDLYVGAGLTVANNLKVNGTSEFIGNVTFRGGTIGIGDSTSDDINIGGEFVSSLVPNTDNAYDIGISTQRWRDGRFSGIITSSTLSVSGVSTFTGAIDANGDLDVDGHTELDNLNVSGVSTFTGAIDANGDLDVDGHTDLLNGLYVSGVSTFAGAADFNGDIDISGDCVVSGNTISEEISSQNLGVSGLTTTQNLRVDGLSSFIGVATFSTNVSVGGTLTAGLIDGGIY